MAKTYKEIMAEARTLVPELAPAEVKQKLDRGEKQEEMRILNDPTVGDEMLVNLFAFALDFPVAEKQSLLEVGTLEARAVRLIETLEFHALEREFSPGIEQAKFRVQ